METKGEDVDEEGNTNETISAAMLLLSELINNDSVSYEEAKIIIFILFVNLLFKTSYTYKYD